MRTVAVAAADDILADLSAWFERSAVYTLAWAGADLRAAVARSATDVQVLIADEVLLRDNMGWLTQLRQLPCAIILLGQSSPDSYRLAMTTGARDLVVRQTWEDHLEAVLEQLEHEAAQHPVVAVFSPKGGVGKTTIAANLACAIGDRLGGPVALLDGDLQFGDLGTLMGLDPASTVYDAARLNRPSGETLERLMAPVPGTRVHLLAAPHHPLQADEVTVEGMLQVLNVLRSTYGAVVVDTALGYSDVNVALLDAADVILLVVTPDVVTVRASARALQLFRDGFGYQDSKIRLVLNRDGSGIPKDEVAAVLARPVAFGLPSDGAWPVHAANDGRPLWVHRPSSALVRALDGVAAGVVPDGVPPSRGRLWRRHPAAQAVSGRS